MKELDDTHFFFFFRHIEQNYGISIPPEKRVMVQSRLTKRAFQLKCRNIDEYIDMVLAKDAVADEVNVMINMISTHLTSFFREPGHFDILAAKIVPHLLERFDATRNQPLMFWSAACSSGEEVHTLAMVLESLRQSGAAGRKGFEYALLGTDISTTMVETARRAIYPISAHHTIPPAYRIPFTMVATSHDRFRMVPELRERCFFRALNLMSQPYPLENRFHVVFCRNVLIYFNPERQLKVLTEICRHLDDEGFLVVGHAESIMSLPLPLRQFAPTVYQKKAAHEV